MSLEVNAPNKCRGLLLIMVFTFVIGIFTGEGWFGPKEAHADTITLYPTANAITGTVTNPTNVYLDDGSGALISANNSSETVRTFDSTNLGTISNVTVWVKYKTSAAPSNDTYAFDAAPDGTNFNQSIVTANTTNQTAYTTASKDLGVLTWAQVGTLAVKCTTVKSAGADPYSVDWDVAYIVVTYAGKTDQTISVTTPAPANAAYNSQFTVAATASSNLPVAYSSGSTSICTNSDATFTMVSGTGTCVVQYNQAGDAAFNAAPQVTSNTTATKIDQATVNISAPSSATYGQTGLSAAASGGSGTGAYSYSAGSSTGCSVNTANGSLTFTSATGTCNITAIRATDSNYNVSNASSPATVTINTAPLAVTAEAKSKTYGAADPALTYTASGFVNGDTNAIMSGTLTRAAGVNVGDYAINKGTVASTSNYTINYTSANLTINAKPVTVTPDAGQSKVYGAAEPTFTYTNTALEGADTITGALGRAAGENVATSPYAYTLGTLTAGSNYTLSLGGTNTFAITAKPVTVTAAAKSKVFGTAEPDLTYTVDTGDTLSGSLARVAGENVGDYAIEQGTVTNTTNPNYSITYVGANLTITVAGQSITITTPSPASAAYLTQFTVAATASSSFAVTYSSGSPGICTNSGDTFTMISGTGTCVVQYDQAGDSNYSAAPQVTNSVTADKADQTIDPITLTPATLAVGGTTEASTLATSGLPVVFSSSTTTVCTLSGTTVAGVNGGDCTIIASQEGNTNYNAAANVEKTFTVDAPAGNPTLSVTITGEGSVNSVPSGIACTSGTCSAEFTSGQSVELTAAPTVSSDFAGWDGACSASGNNPVCTVIVSGLTEVAANFTAKQLVRVGDNYYASMQAAYNAAGEGATLKGSIQTLFEDLNFNLTPNISFDGGYDETWTKVVDANTTISGSVTLAGGSVTISNMIIQ